MTQSYEKELNDIYLKLETRLDDVYLCLIFAFIILGVYIAYVCTPHYLFSHMSSGISFSRLVLKCLEAGEVVDNRPSHT